MTRFTATSSSTANTVCVFRNSAEAAAAVAELRSLTDVPSLVKLQTAHLLKHQQERQPNRIGGAPAFNQLNLPDAISMVLDLVEEDEF